MAKASSATHDEAATPVATTRRTRSQSAEPSQQPPRPASRSARGGKKTVTPDAEVPKQRTTKRNPVLEPVTEEPSPEKVADIEMHVPIEEDQFAPHIGNLRTSIALSAISGTTAKTSFSMDEAKLVDPDTVVITLPNLAAASEELLRLILPQGLQTPQENFKEIRRTGSKLNKQYSIRMGNIHHYKPHFGSQEYVQPRVVLKALFENTDPDDLPEAPWRPDAIIMRINVNQMLNALLIGCDQTDWTAERAVTLESILHFFPGCIAGREYSSLTFEFFLNLAAHAAILKLEASANTDPNLNPHAVIDSVFFDDDGAFMFAETLGLSDATRKDYENGLKSLRKLVAQLKHPLKNDGMGTAAAIGRLRARYQWEDFIDHAMHYHASRKRELDRRIELAGGVQQISDALGEELLRQEQAEQAAMIRASLAKSTTPRTSLVNMVLLKGKEKSIVEKSAPLQAPPAEVAGPLRPTTEVLPTRDLDIQHGQPESATGVPPGEATAMKSASFYKAQRAYAERERAKRKWTDPQANAYRVDTHFPGDTPEPDDRRQPVSTRKTRDPVERPNKGKRPFIEEDVEEEDEEEEQREEEQLGFVPDPTQDRGLRDENDEDEEENAFQTDTRNHPPLSERRSRVSFADTYRRRPESSAPGPSASSRYSSVASGPMPPKKQRKNPGSSIPPPELLRDERDEDPPARTQFQVAKSLAKQNRVGAQRTKQPRPRSPWTDEEEAALIDLIEEHGGEGVSYSEFKVIDASREDKKLFRRTAEDLRFKARNMKVTMLLAGNGLPDNWEHVMLAKRDIQKLHDRDIPYEQERQRYGTNMDFDE